MFCLENLPVKPFEKHITLLMAIINNAVEKYNNGGKELSVNGDLDVETPNVENAGQISPAGMDQGCKST